MNVRIYDMSHVSRPHLDITADEVISHKGGTLILMPHIHPAYATLEDDTVPTSISNLARECTQGFDLSLSHDWTVKVRTTIV